MIAAFDGKKVAYHRDRLKVVRAVATANPVVAVYWNYYYSCFLLRKRASMEGQSMPQGWAVSTSAEVGGRGARRPPAREWAPEGSVCPVGTTP